MGVGFEIQLEKLMRTPKGFSINYDTRPSEMHQMYEEILCKEKELAAEVYMQRCIEKYL